MSEATAPGGAEMIPLPPGRHGIPAELVRESQRRRLMTAAAETLAERGYGSITVTEVAKRAKVSTAAFYKHFDDLWACLLAAYEADAELLRERIAGAGAAGSGERERLQAAVGTALALGGADPALALLLSVPPPPQAPALRAARQRFVAGLAAMLREDHGGREAQLVAAALALVASRARAEGGRGLRDLTPTLTAVLLAQTAAQPPAAPGS